MERLRFMLRVGGGKRIHDCTNQQAGHIQVDLCCDIIKSCDEILCKISYDISGQQTRFLGLHLKDD